MHQLKKRNLYLKSWRRKLTNSMVLLQGNNFTNYISITQNHNPYKNNYRCPRYGKIYVKAAKSCLDKGSDYANKEILRLERMLAKVKT